VMNKQWVYLIFLVISSGDSFILRDKENVIVVPSVAFRDHTKVGSTDWILHNRGWYYKEDPLQAYVMQTSLEKIIGKNLDRNRIKLFTADGRKKQKLCLDDWKRPLCTVTDEEGRIENTFQIQENELKQLVHTDTKFLYQMSVSKNNLRSTGEIYLCDDQGMTFISDLDDTIKITGVTSTTDTLINTFSGDFKPVSGMADRYQSWQKKYNATFAYITASPDQLYPFLREFIDREKFPSGSFHMRHFTWSNQNFLSFFQSTDYIRKKIDTINMFMNNTFNRTFVLIGDVFQKDPDIYASIYAIYPNRIARIFIRKYKNDTSGQQRLEQVFKDIPREKWTTFETGDDLPNKVFL